MEQVVEWEFAGEVGVLAGIYLSAILPTIYSTWTDSELYVGNRGGKPATDSVHYDTARHGTARHDDY
jgi:hypothetical protein